MKPNLCIISTLKPLNDIRMYHKFALTLHKANKYHINIIGYPVKNWAEQEGGIRFFPLKAFNRMSASRFFQTWKIFKLLVKLKPKVIIGNTHEVLIVIVLYKILFGAKLIYDIRENYYRNIRHGAAYKFPINWILAIYVRLKEWLAAPFIKHFLLAEFCYQQELPFVPLNRSMVLPNLALIESKQNGPILLNHNKLRFVFTGTIAREHGVFTAIKWVQALQKVAPSVELLIIGYCAQQEVLQQIQKLTATNHHIHLKGGSKHVAYPKIIEAIKQADMGIISYELSPMNGDRIPTKLYEYIALKLPILMIPHTPWMKITDAFQAAVYWEENTSASAVLKMINQTIFYQKQVVNQPVTWSSMAEKLLKVID